VRKAGGVDQKGHWWRTWQVKAGAGLLLLSLFIYVVHFLLFRDLHHILIYGLGELAFVPIEVLFVTLILHKVLEERERAARLRKMNMVIGVFFSEVGTGLLRHLRAFDCHLSRTEQLLLDLRSDQAIDLLHLAATMKNGDFEVKCEAGELGGLRQFLLGKRDFMLKLLENPNLLEHESFTELLWAVFHMTEEFAYRPDITAASGPDQKHLLGDMNRSYHLLVREWLMYMGHLKADYPYLYSLAVRLNPFDPQASAEVKG
jgi:hypothetical protein